ncbi:helix-turn-helix domain-containing protein [Silvanigrella sp.]|jgi:transcriptional regulator with XRE-family HTH domain|uniref:helix-turn-helix domain-containing protein n=1 Tax=Silvanigrella sp. TaxID=2024976 RepID=UPI0037CBEEAD
MEIGKTLKEIRIARGLNQTEFANLIGISESAVCQYERGGRYPSAEILAKISSSLNVSCDYLLGLKLENNDILLSLKESDKNIIMRLIDALKNR